MKKIYVYRFSVKEEVLVLSYRPDRVVYKEAIMTNNPNLVLGRKNSFLGFHVIDLPKKIIRVIKRKIGLSIFKENPTIKSGKVAVAPYGGMFFHKNLIDTIAYPREEFFVYSDDHEWSYRITKNKGTIYLVLNSEIKDIDISWNVNKKESVFSVISKGEPFRVYYSVRNRVYFDLKYLVKNKFIYKINMYLFIIILQFFRNRSNLKRYKVFKKAINDGMNNRLGKIDL